ncbi:hypothetical protein O181_086519 [Austropuccinia psidii MF-1]|uniref:Uncharacterized protein n=1 Tax=Austropuccinia psidii MF-1 TaxID=1389203 RepID=A0A9Q3INE1_9BASI|nr:hypothetical protein [Austropuccinia psidii MF-1]
MPSTRSGANYNRSSSSQKGHRRYYGRRQSVTEGQGSVDDLQIDELCHSEADKTVLTSKRADNATRSLTGHLKSQPRGSQQFIAAQRVPDSADLWKNCMISYPTLRKFLGHLNTYKLLNGWYP